MLLPNDIPKSMCWLAYDNTLSEFIKEGVQVLPAVQRRQVCVYAAVSVKLKRC